MKKILSLILLIIISISLIGCNSYEYVNYVDDVSYELFDYYVIEKREVVEFDYDYLKEVYDYDNIAYQIENEKIVSKTYYGHIKGEGTGKSLVKATLYKDGVPFQNLVLGCFIVVDYESDFMIPINNYTQFVSLLRTNNTAIFIINRDIEFPDFYDYEIIEEFNGVIINPNRYTLSNINNTEALFGTLDNAFIDGLIIENSSFTGVNSAVIAKETNLSSLSNIHVTDTTITATNDAAGLVVDSKNTIYNKVSFEGDITGGNLAAGLIANSNNGTDGFNYFISNNMTTSYAYTDLTVTSPSGIASGLIGNITSSAVIESSYFVGEVIANTIYPISNNSIDSVVYYSNVYTSISTEGLDKNLFGEGKIYGIPYEAFFYGTVLPGLEDFESQSGKNPQN